MGLNFDVIEYCRKLKASKQPPYHCPVVECGKVYRSMCGLQYHLVNYDHDNPNPEPQTPGMYIFFWIIHIYQLENYAFALVGL